MRRAAPALAAALLLSLASLATSAAPRAEAAQHAAASPTPLLAYYYIWFTPSSWSRAKRDLPLLGGYSSDDTQVMRQHVRWAKAAGINGFLVSWKSTPALDDRLARLIQVADQEHFRLGIVYEGLDFHRRPLPIATVKHDLERFTATFAGDRAFRIFDRPLVIWAGTWKYTTAQIRFATKNVRGRAARARLRQEREGLRPRRATRRRRRLLLVVRQSAALSRLRPQAPGHGRGRARRGAASGSHPPRPASTRAASAARASSGARTATRCAPSSTRLRRPRPTRSA